MVIDTINPRWIDKRPAWDITVNGEIFEIGVKDTDIFKQMKIAYDKQLISEFDFMYGGCFGVRQWTVEAYVKSKLN